MIPPTFDPDDDDHELDAARPHDYLPTQLERLDRCGLCGARRLAPIHLRAR